MVIRRVRLRTDLTARLSSVRLVRYHSALWVKMMKGAVGDGSNENVFFNNINKDTNLAVPIIHPKKTFFVMVKVEIVEEKDQQGSSPYASDGSSRSSSTTSLSSVSSQISAEESFFDRIAALVDIVPPSTRHNLSSKLSKTTSFVKRSGRIIGNVVWIVTTSALLVGLPLALSLEDEAKIVAQEKEMLAQQQGAQQVCTESHSTSRPPFISLLSDAIN